VTVAGRAPDERDVRFRRDVAVLFDDSDLFAELSPRQHLELLFADVRR
jgi:ABC-2 type transport system ATP-binding protein